MSTKSNIRIIKFLLWVSLAMNALMLLVLANHVEKKGGISYLRKKFTHQSYSENSYEGFYYKMKTGTFREMPAGILGSTFIYKLQNEDRYIQGNACRFKCNYHPGQLHC